MLTSTQACSPALGTQWHVSISLQNATQLCVSGIQPAQSYTFFSHCTNALMLMALFSRPLAEPCLYLSSLHLQDGALKPMCIFLRSLPLTPTYHPALEPPASSLCEWAERSLSQVHARSSSSESNPREMGCQF